MKTPVTGKKIVQNCSQNIQNAVLTSSKALNFEGKFEVKLNNEYIE